MKKLISIISCVMLSATLYAQDAFSSLHYSSRIKAKNTAFLPTLYESELQDSFLGVTSSLIASYNHSFGESEFNNYSFGFSLGYKGDRKLSFLFDYEKFKGKQTKFINDYLDEYQVFPGRGEVIVNGNSYSFKDLNYRIAYDISKHFDVELGQSKHFIGSGYRSLLLSDNSSNYPFLRVTTTFWKVKYTNLYTTFIDSYSSPDKRKKHATFHYLDMQLLENLSFGIFESVLWQSKVEEYNNGYELAYLNPIIFYRPVEFSMGSNKGNALMGISLNLSFKQYKLYGQILLDDLNISRQKNRDENYSEGFFQNKFAYQIGLKANQLFNLKDLFALAEYNQAQPYTYAHKIPMQNYTHMNQALAHPLGANFKEMIGILNYNYKEWNLELKWNHAIYGEDTMGTHYGKNIFLSDLEAQNEGQQYSYGNFNGQGIKTTQDYVTATISHPIKQSKIYLYGQLISRQISSDLQDVNHLYFLIGIKTNLHNSYLDF
jgi:hypothetical protein|tara:strand:- start:2469 stop:3932 length:1464 start_codon:yes stop_codon:yes gene_type:complete